MNAKEIRWKQRYNNFSNALQEMEEAISKTSYTKLERAGVVQTFEFTFELAWKTLKDCLESEGYDVKTPREVIKQAFEISYIKDGHTWLEALESRNTAAHLYDEVHTNKLIALLKTKYIFILRDLNVLFKDKL